MRCLKGYLTVGRALKLKKVLFNLIIAVILFFPTAVFAFTQPAPVVFYGDIQSGYSNHRKIVAGIEAQYPKIVVNTGDLASYRYDLSAWLTFDSTVANLRSNSLFLPVIGNHDAYSGYFNQRFALPRGGRYYSKIYNRLYLIFLDSNANFKKDTYQYNWLVGQLARAKSLGKTRIVVFHHPPISSDGGEANPKKLLPLFYKYSVKLVFSGHYHHYERLKYQRTNFIVTGGGGATLYPLTNPVGIYSQKYVRSYHFCRLDLEENLLKITVFDRELNIIDQTNIKY